jgi:3-hydroxybutyryl-CoA dehydrogenase
MTELKHAVVIGTGMMGPGITATLAGAIPRVTIVSRSSEGAARGQERARQFLDLRIRNRWADPATAGEIDSSSDLDEAVKATDLVIESAPESMTFKQELFARLDKIAPENAILASNTSGLSITEIATHCGRPERVLTAHFWNPPHLMPLVEVVKGERTDDAVAQRMMELLRRSGKTPVLVRKDRPGQLGNRLQMALVREACFIVQEGIASVEDVDLAARTGFGLRLPVYGIFEHQDAVGLDMGLGILDYIASDLYNQAKAPDSYRDRVSQGKLGAKTGEGFYDWSERSMDDVKKRRDEFVLDFLNRFGAR